MNYQILDLYSDYLLSSFGQTTATGLARVLEGGLSHDQITRMLARVCYELYQVEHYTEGYGQESIPQRCW